MKFTYFLGLFLIAILFTQCKSTKFDKTPPFSVTGANYNYWVGGIPGVSGIKVFIAFKSNEPVMFDSLYFAKRTTKISLKKVNGKEYIIAHFNTSTVNNKEDLILHADGKKELNNPIPTKTSFPFELKENEAVISYQENGKIKYYKIKNLQKTAIDFYP